MLNEVATQDLFRKGEAFTETIALTRILVVDDDEQMRQYLREILLGGGYKWVDLAADSNQAMDFLKTYLYHVVLADINMPGMNGLQLLEHLHAHYGAIAVLMITGLPDVVSAVDAIKKGACNYLAKPFLAQELLDDVAAALQQQREHETVKVPSPLCRLARKYKALRNLGSGSMGIVMLVEKDGRNFAMKLLRSDDRNALANTRCQRFLREGQILADINHPCIVKIYEYGLPEPGEEGVPFIVMEFVPGNALNRLIEQQCLSLDDKIGILNQIASALDVVHRYGIIHRDVKPDNVMVTKDMHAKLMDFGVAQINNSALTMTAEMIGSPAYMAPECFEKKKVEMDARVDIFALGVLGYEMFTGFRPFHGQVFADLAQSIRSSRPPAPRTLVPELPVEMESILARMLAKAPDDRFQTAGEIVAAIKRMKAGSLMRALKKDIGFRSLMRALMPPKRVWQ